MIKSKEESVFLFIPPAYGRIVPPLGTPALLGFLRAEGVFAVQSDLNMLYYDYLKRNKLQKILTQSYKQGKTKKKVYYRRLLQDKNTYTEPVYDFENNPGSSFKFTEKILGSEFLPRYISDQRENPFVDFFYDQVYPQIKKDSDSLVGFSVTSPSQVIASFTFGHLIKKLFPRTKVVLGGQWVSLYREELYKRNDFIDFYDYLVYFEGEIPLVRLIDAVRNNKPLAAVPNLIYPGQGRWVYSPKIAEVNLNRLPAPDFDGLPLKRYLFSRDRLSLTIETSRGCYWNKCIFCADLPFPKPRYREKNPDLVIRDIKELIKKYRVRHLCISDAVFAPAQMKKIAKKLLKEGLKISWWAWSRFDPAMDIQALRLAKKSGCTTLGFGLESMNQRVLDFIRKGTKLNIIRRIIKNSLDLKLTIYCQVIIGLPSETTEEARDTLFSLIAYNKNGKTVPAALNLYYLTPKTEIFLDPASFGVKMVHAKKLPFRFVYPFKYSRGDMDRLKARQIINVYNDIFRPGK